MRVVRDGDARPMRPLLVSAVARLTVVVGRRARHRLTPSCGTSATPSTAQLDPDHDVDWVETGGDRLDDCARYGSNGFGQPGGAASLEWIPGQLRITRRRTAATLSTWTLTARGAGLARAATASRRGQIVSGTTPSSSSASRAASCSAAFFVEPRPIPSWAPATWAAHTKRRSCGGPSISSTV